MFISGVFITCISVFDSNALRVCPILVCSRLKCTVLLCSVLVYLGYGMFIGISEFILCGKISNIEQVFFGFFVSYYCIDWSEIC